MSVSSRRLAAATAAAAVLAAAAVPAGAVVIIPRDGNVQTVGKTQVIRLAGETRQGTALSVAQASQLSTSGTVMDKVALLAASADFPDALASAPLATALGAPVLLTEKDGTVSSAVADQLATYDTVIVVSGAGHVPDATLDSLRARQLDVVRYAGETRYDTAAVLALATLYWNAVTGLDGTSPRPSIGTVSVYLANGKQFPDALAAGPVASSEENGIVLLSDGNALPSVTAAALKGDFSEIAGVEAGTLTKFQSWWNGLNAKVQVQTVGGAARSAARAGEIGALYDLVGDDRYQTAAKVSQFGRNRGVFTAGVVLASGQNFADGVVGGALGGHLKAPLLLTARDGLPAATSAQISGNIRPYDVVAVVGGEGSVSSGVVDQVAGILPK